MAIHESLSLWCYHPLIGKKRLGHFYGGGVWASDYFVRNRNHFNIIDCDLREKIKSRFVKGDSVFFLHCNVEFDVWWNCFNFHYLLDSNCSYTMPIRVTVWCPALLSPEAGAGFFVNHDNKR